MKMSALQMSRPVLITHGKNFWFHSKIYPSEAHHILRKLQEHRATILQAGFPNIYLERMLNASL